MQENSLNATVSNGIDQLKVGDLSAARAIFNQVIINNPETPEVYQEVFLAYFNYGHFAEAVEVFAVADNKIPAMPVDNHFQILDVLMQKKDYVNAVKVCRMAQQRGEMKPQVLQKLDNMLEIRLVDYLCNGKHQLAVDIIKDAFPDITDQENRNEYGTLSIRNIHFRYTLIIEILYAAALCKERGLQVPLPKFKGRVNSAIQPIIAVLEYYDKYLYQGAEKLSNQELSYINSSKRHSENYVIGRVEGAPPVHKYNNVYHHKDVNALFDARGYYIPSSMTWHHRWHPVSRHQEYTLEVSHYSPQEISADSYCEAEEVLYLGGNFISSKLNFGHVFLEVTSRLWYLAENDFNGKILLDVPPLEKLPSYFLELLENLGWEYRPDKIIYQDRNILFERIIIPEMSHRWTAFHYTCNNNLFGKIGESMRQKPVSSNVAAHKNKRKFYLSRVKSNKAVDGIRFGEDIIEKIFEDNGYDVVYCHEYNLTETSQMFHDAEIIVSPYQSGCYRLMMANCDNLRLAFFGYDIENCSFENIYLFFNYMKCFGRMDFYQVLHIDPKDWELVKASNSFPEKPFIVPSYFDIQEVLELLKADNLIAADYSLAGITEVQRNIEQDFRKELAKYLPQ